MRKKEEYNQLSHYPAALFFYQTAGIVYVWSGPSACRFQACAAASDRYTQHRGKPGQPRCCRQSCGRNKRKMLEMTASPDLKEQPVPTDSLQKAIDPKRWVPNPTKATWLALVIPGGGQIYNRKYWKLPIFYGGFAGCAYALTWNSKMYKDYSAAYKDAVNGNFNSSTITDLLPPNYNYTESQLTETLRKRKDTFRRYRDLSIFAFIGVYLLSVVDAYVDAELSNFDITPDLSMKVEPAIINSQMTGSSNKNVGVQCSFRF